MKKNMLLSIASLFVIFGSTKAFAYCETEARTFIENQYGVRTIDAKQLGGGGGQGRPMDTEVWVKADNNSTYSVYFMLNNCSNITRHIAW